MKLFEQRVTLRKQRRWLSREGTLWGEAPNTTQQKQRHHSCFLMVFKITIIIVLTGAYVSVPAQWL